MLTYNYVYYIFLFYRILCFIYFFNALMFLWFCENDPYNVVSYMLNAIRVYALFKIVCCILHNVVIKIFLFVEILSCQMLNGIWYNRYTYCNMQNIAHFLNNFVKSGSQERLTDSDR